MSELEKFHSLIEQGFQEAADELAQMEASVAGIEQMVPALPAMKTSELVISLTMMSKQITEMTTEMLEDFPSMDDQDDEEKKVVELVNRLAAASISFAAELDARVPAREQG